MQLPTADLVAKGLLKKKTPGDYISVLVEDDDGQSGFRRLKVQSNSTSTWALTLHARSNHNKAACALANKLTRICYATLRDATPYGQPVPPGRFAS